MLKSPILTFSLIIPVIIFELLYDGIDIWLVNLFLYTSDIVSCTDSYMLLKWLFCLSILACLSTSEVVSTTDSYMFIENGVIYTIYIYIYTPSPLFSRKHIFGVFIWHFVSILCQFTWIAGFKDCISSKTCSLSNRYPGCLFPCRVLSLNVQPPRYLRWM